MLASCAEAIDGRVALRRSSFEFRAFVRQQASSDFQFALGSCRGRGFLWLPAAHYRDAGILLGAIDLEFADDPYALFAIFDSVIDEAVGAGDEFSGEGDDLVRCGAQQLGADYP